MKKDGLIFFLSAMVCILFLSSLIIHTREAGKSSSDLEKANLEAIQDVHRQKAEFEDQSQVIGEELGLELENYKAAKKAYQKLLSQSADFRPLSYQGFSDRLDTSSFKKSSGAFFFDPGYLYEAIQKDVLPTEAQIKENISSQQKAYQVDKDTKYILDQILSHAGIPMEDYWDTVVYVQEAKLQLSVNLSNAYLKAQGKEPMYGRSPTSQQTSISSEAFHAMDQEVAAYLRTLEKDR